MNVQTPHKLNNDGKPIPSVFDHEKVDGYQLQLRFISWATPLLEEAKKVAPGKSREVCDQLDRASLSALLNTAEGNGKRRGRSRAKFFDDARGSATECAACLDALVAKGIFMPERVLEGKTVFLRIVSILCKLVERFDHVEELLHEEPVQYRIGSEREGKSRTRTSTRRRTS